MALVFDRASDGLQARWLEVDAACPTLQSCVGETFDRASTGAWIEPPLWSRRHRLSCAVSLGYDSTMKNLGWGLLRTLVALSFAACGDDDAPRDGAVDSPPPCSVDADCDDSLFCTGEATCEPANPRSDARGCFTASLPCAEGTCIEAEARCALGCADADGDGFDDSECGGADCDDSNPDRHPGAIEVCDAAGVDEDCDLATFGTRDADGDGYVDLMCCNLDGGAASCGSDCDDHDSGVHPDLPDLCADAVDNDCDGEVDEGGVLFADMDNDGRGAPGTGMDGPCIPGRVQNDHDCDDSRADVYGGGVAAIELCDGVDNDCSLPGDDAGGADLLEDADGDGHSATDASCVGLGEPGAPGSAFPKDDCDDRDPAVHGDAIELVGDVTDNDCDGTVDERILCDPVSSATGCLDEFRCNAWFADSAGCVPGTGTRREGETCARQSIENLDDCEDGLTCWGGRCHSFCAMGCSGGLRCVDAYFGYGVCLESCDPLFQGCATSGAGCYLTGDRGSCAPSEPSGTGADGEMCSSLNGCAPGLQCVPGSSLADCPGTSCCTPFCDLNEPDPCSGGETCESPYPSPASIPPGFDALGWCRVAS